MRNNKQIHLTMRMKVMKMKILLDSIDKNTIKEPTKQRQQDPHIPEKSIGKKNYLTVLDAARCGGVAVYASPSTGIHTTTSSASDHDASSSAFRKLFRTNSNYLKESAVEKC
ncbi:hypothetical protein M9H77_12803 [Catharanthus roseus]|uniref:Uncharacterized protein n=1 Tax=Catharanthus roseus TaxID=4058 RepID=A0ACC0BIC7_CATRO|nr:hypothetical protein M9H77_12803 [Catharanthus roseus]